MAALTNNIFFLSFFLELAFLRILNIRNDKFIEHLRHESKITQNWNNTVCKRSLKCLTLNDDNSIKIIPRLKILKQ